MYVKVSNGAVEQYPYTLGNLRRDNPNTSFPKYLSDDFLVEWGLHSVSVDDVPSYNEATQNAEQNSVPTLSNGVWALGWSVTSKTSEQMQEYETSLTESNRSIRDRKLSETDFYALSDVTMSAEMTAYRQALRDITTHANWPHLEEADWPTKP